jgi:hypothetical protein
MFLLPSAKFSAHNNKDPHRHHILTFLLQNINTEFIGIYMVYVHNKFHMINSCGLLHYARYQTESYITISCSHHFVVLKIR